MAQVYTKVKLYLEANSKTWNDTKVKVQDDGDGAYIKLWDYVKESAIDTELTFCGLIMGDHSKTGINTMLNTGTMVGVGSNIFGAHFPPKFIPSFSWGSGTNFMEHDFIKFCSTAEKVMARRGLTLAKENKSALKWVFQASTKFR